LSCIPWETYVLYSDGLGPRHVRVTYDQGEMEVMTLSSHHENDKKRLGRLVETLTEELEIDIASFGSMTFRNAELLRGLEADDCYWIENEPHVRGRKDIDLDNDPPPDVALEVEISRSSLNRMSIYAALRVPEVWRWDGETLSVHLLTTRGAYRVSKCSKAFPFLPLDDLRAFLVRNDLSETQLIRAFRAWVREHREDWLA
jgi:Uma2 family endonuclease